MGEITRTEVAIVATMIRTERKTSRGAAPAKRDRKIEVTAPRTRPLSRVRVTIEFRSVSDSLVFPLMVGFIVPTWRAVPSLPA